MIGNIGKLKYWFPVIQIPKKLESINPMLMEQALTSSSKKRSLTNHHEDGKQGQRHSTNPDWTQMLVLDRVVNAVQSVRKLKHNNVHLKFTQCYKPVWPQ